LPLVADAPASTSSLKVLHAASGAPFETGEKGTPGHDPARLAAFLRYWSP